MRDFYQSHFTQASATRTRIHARAQNRVGESGQALDLDPVALVRAPGEDFACIPSTIHTRQMSAPEKLRLLDDLWADSSGEDVPSSAWHDEVLAEPDRLIEFGEEKFVDWETAKRQLREAVTGNWHAEPEFSSISQPVFSNVTVPSARYGLAFGGSGTMRFSECPCSATT